MVNQVADQMSDAEMLTVVVTIISLIITIMSGYNMVMISQLNKKLSDLELRLTAALIKIPEKYVTAESCNAEKNRLYERGYEKEKEMDRISNDISKISEWVRLHNGYSKS